MTRWVNVLASSPGDLQSVPRTLVVEGKNAFKLPSDLRMHHIACMATHTQMNKEIQLKADVVHICNPSTREAWTDRSVGSRPAWLAE